jgi:NTP pyrophosphatase (non-canonical NTP hydrolase)
VEEPCGPGKSVLSLLSHGRELYGFRRFARAARGGYRDRTKQTLIGRRRMLVGVDLRDFQQLIERMYSHKDRQRGSAGTFLWMMEEVGELAAAIGDKTDERNKREEFADVLAWLVTLANIEGVDLSDAIHAKYGTGCPGCGKMVCTCDAKP